MTGYMFWRRRRTHETCTREVVVEQNVKSEERVAEVAGVAGRVLIAVMETCGGKQVVVWRSTTSRLTFDDRMAVLLAHRFKYRRQKVTALGGQVVVVKVVADVDRYLDVPSDVGKFLAQNRSVGGDVDFDVRPRDGRPSRMGCRARAALALASREHRR
jgi:hypothetical protein